MTIDSSITFHVDPYDVSRSFFDSVVGVELAKRGLRHAFYRCFGYLPNLPDEINRRELVASEIDDKGRASKELRGWEEGLIEIHIERTPETRQRIEVWGYFVRQEAAAKCLTALGNHLPREVAPTDGETVTVNFWNVKTTHRGYEPQRESQVMSVPRWQTIAENYPEQVRPNLASTMQLQESSYRSSRLMLWRGLPGTGKTWAVRALMREWLGWCTYHYVINPAVFFSNSTYMLSLLAKVSEVGEDDDIRKWSLIILEDAGEFIAMDARHQRGQGLAKLLNLCDGLLGQGQRLLFLITTNEEVRNLHPAVARFGRCLTNLEFPEFSEPEAQEWLAAHGCAAPKALKQRTLSDLFAAAGTMAPIANEVPMRRMGFVR